MLDLISFRAGMYGVGYGGTPASAHLSTCSPACLPCICCDKLPGPPPGWPMPPHPGRPMPPFLLWANTQVLTTHKHRPLLRQLLSRWLPRSLQASRPSGAPAVDSRDQAPLALDDFQEDGENESLLYLRVRASSVGSEVDSEDEAQRAHDRGRG